MGAVPDTCHAMVKSHVLCLLPVSLITELSPGVTG